MHSNDPPPTSCLCPGVSCVTVATHSTPSFVQEASGTGTFHITLDRLLHSFTVAFHRLLDGTNLRRRSDIGVPTYFRMPEYTRHPAFPLRAVLAVFWVTVSIVYSAIPTLRRYPPFLHRSNNPHTAGRTWLAPRTTTFRQKCWQKPTVSSSVPASLNHRF